VRRDIRAASRASLFGFIGWVVMVEQR
jgi:hypothetical protein